MASNSSGDSLVFLRPYFATLKQIPDLFSRTTNITIAGVTISVNQRLQYLASTEVKNALSDLSSDAVRVLVRTGMATMYSKTSLASFSNNEPALKELADADLIELQIGNINDSAHRDYDVKWKVTQLGQHAYSFILEVVIDQLLGGTSSSDELK